MTNIDILMMVSVFGIMLTILIYINTRNVDFLNIDELVTEEMDLQKNKILEYNNAKKDNAHYNHETVNISDKSGIGIDNIRNPELRMESVIQDLSEFINIVMVNELYSIELNGGLNIAKDDRFKEVVKIITTKILDSMSDNFRAKLYLFMNENLLVETIHSNVTRKVIGHVSKSKAVNIK